jgi:hypothetical protein
MRQLIVGICILAATVTLAFASGRPTIPPVATPPATVPNDKGGAELRIPVPEEDQHPAGCHKRYENDRKAPQAPYIDLKCV